MKKVTIEKVNDEYYVIEYVKQASNLYLEADELEKIVKTQKKVFKNWKDLMLFLKKYLGLVRTVKGKKLF